MNLAPLAPQVWGEKDGKVPPSPLLRGDAVRQRGRGFRGLNILKHKPDDLCVHNSLKRGTSA